jgi:hypothetical protein
LLCLLVEAPAFRPCAGIAVGPEQDQWSITVKLLGGGEEETMFKLYFKTYQFFRPIIKAHQYEIILY